MNQGQFPSEDVTYKRKKTIINVAYFIMIFGASILFVRYALPHLWSFVIAVIVILLLRKPAHDFLYKKLKFDYKASSVVLVLLFYGTIGLATALLVLFIVNKLKNLIGGLPGFFENTVSPLITQAFEGIENLLESINDRFGINLIDAIKPTAGSIGTGAAVESSGIAGEIIGSSATEIKQGSLISIDNLSESFINLLTSTIGSVSKTIISNSPSIASSVSTVILNVVICVVSTAFGLMDFDLLTTFLGKQLSPPRYNFWYRVVKHLGKVLGQYIVSYGLIMFITFGELALGLLIILRDSSAVAIAAIIAVFDILPIIGSGLFLFPWAVISLFTGSVGTGIGLLILWFVLIVVRNIIEPKIVGDKVGMHPLITLVAMIAGQFIYGGIGILLLPVSLALIQDLNKEGIIHIYKPLGKDDYKEPERGIIIGKFIKMSDKFKGFGGNLFRKKGNEKTDKDDFSSGLKNETSESTEESAKSGPVESKDSCESNGYYPSSDFKGNSVKNGKNTKSKGKKSGKK